MRINEMCAKQDCITPSSNVDLVTLPPCGKSHIQHIRIVNHQIGIWRGPTQQNPTSPKQAEAMVGKMKMETWSISGMKDLPDLAVATSDSVETDEDSDFVGVNSIENAISSEVEDGESDYD